jgi:hypothetical protein
MELDRLNHVLRHGTASFVLGSEHWKGMKAGRYEAGADSGTTTP